MVIPTLIVIDESAPDNGADIMLSRIKVKKKNLHKLMQGLKGMFPGKYFKIITLATYLDVYGSHRK